MEADKKCPSDMGYTWRYLTEIGWPNAGEGLSVRCIAEEGM